MKIKFIEKYEENEGVYTFSFEPQESLNWLAGQYIDIEVDHLQPDNKGTHRWFSISSAPFENKIMITTKIAGRDSSFKKALYNLQPGTYINSGKPRGDFILDESNDKHVLIAGGIGITPYRSMIKQAGHENMSIDAFLLHTDTSRQFIFEKELGLAGKNLHYFKLQKFSRRLEISDFNSMPTDAAFYLSGPRAMVENYHQLLQDMGIMNIKTDYFSGY